MRNYPALALESLAEMKYQFLNPDDLTLLLCQAVASEEALES